MDDFEKLIAEMKQALEQKDQEIEKLQQELTELKQRWQRISAPQEMPYSEI